MPPKRTDEISIKLRHEAKAIYENLPKKGKGEWVSDAIITKHAQDAGTGTQQQIDELRGRIEKLEGGKG
jgi:TolA-binding protein